MTTKKLFITLLCMFSFVSVFAENKDLKNDVTMVSYEQSWFDYEGRMALKNNTSMDINHIVFQITYLDMSDNELDYEVFERRVNIAPGKTKILSIPANRHLRNYHYYKTKDDKGHPTFKIEFQLKDYDVEKEVADDSGDCYETDKRHYTKNPFLFDNSFTILVIIVILIFIGVCVGLYVIVAVMAKKRNRNVAAWVLLSLIATPLLMIIILLVIGKDNHTERLQ
ncbi:MAG: hypothetical protein J6X62_07135 [Bacteroidales bacterium]|nr:hypothetical protein [Bacteroidales bacterium]